MRHVARETMGADLRRWRVARGLALAETARRAELARSTLYRWEDGEAPNGDGLLRLLDVLGVAGPERTRVLAAAAPGATELMRSSLGSPVHLGQALRSLRVLEAVSQTEAARRTGVTQGALAKWEAGTYRPNDEALARLLLALRASPEDAAWARRLAREEPFDLGDPDRARAWLAANSPEYNAPNLPALLAFEREAWVRAAHDARWEPVLVEAMGWRAFAHMYLGEIDAQRAAARGGLALARRSGAWDEAATSALVHWFDVRHDHRVTVQALTTYLERVRTPWSRHAILFDQASIIAYYDPDRAEKIGRILVEEAPEDPLSRATDGVTKDNGRFQLANVYQIQGKWEAAFEVTLAIVGLRDPKAWVDPEAMSIHLGAAQRLGETPIPGVAERLARYHREARTWQARDHTKRSPLPPNWRVRS